MTKVFMVKESGEKIHVHNWWCGTCNALSHSEVQGRFPLDAELDYPEPKPESKACPKCNGLAEFSSAGSRRVMVRLDNGQEIDRVTKHPGACYEERQPYYDRRTRAKRTGPDGRVLTVICPDGRPWTIDSRASNCTMPQDNDHYCWVRTGSPETGDLSVHKDGHTCGAGAGSIDTGSYHGFLREGVFVSC